MSCCPDAGTRRFSEKTIHHGRGDKINGTALSEVRQKNLTGSAAQQIVATNMFELEFRIS